MKRVVSLLLIFLLLISLTGCKYDKTDFSIRRVGDSDIITENMLGALPENTFFMEIMFKNQDMIRNADFVRNEKGIVTDVTLYPVHCEITEGNLTFFGHVTSASHKGSFDLIEKGFKENILIFTEDKSELPAETLIFSITYTLKNNTKTRTRTYKVNMWELIKAYNQEQGTDWFGLT